MPWAFLVLPLPWLVWTFAPPAAERHIAVRVPFFAVLSDIGASPPSPGQDSPARRNLRTLFLIVMWCLLVTALARPQWIGSPITRTESARNIMITVDLSGSMETRDMYPEGSNKALTRLDMVKQSLQNFVAARKHDRLGLIAFGSAAYLQSPFTEDHDTWLELVDELQVGMAGQQTMLGDAIGLAIDTLRRSDIRNRVLVLLTDGKDTDSRIPPVEAAKIAGFHDIRIHTIAIGKDDPGNPEAADIGTLARIAEETGGQAFEAPSRSALEQVITTLGKLEPEEYETQSFSPRHDLFHIPLAVMGLGLVLATLFGLLRSFLTKARQVKDASV